MSSHRGGRPPLNKNSGYRGRGGFTARGRRVGSGRIVSEAKDQRSQSPQPHEQPPQAPQQPWVRNQRDGQDPSHPSQAGRGKTQDNNANRGGYQKHTSTQQKRKFNPFCYTHMVKMATESNSNEIVQILANSDHEFDNFIRERMRLDFFILLMKVLVKVCHSDYDENKSKILSQVCNEGHFLSSFLTAIMEAHREKSTDETKHMIVNMLSIFETVLKTMPRTACDSLKSIVMGCSCCIGTILPGDTDILQRFSDLEKELETAVAKLKEEEQDSQARRKQNFTTRMQMQKPSDRIKDLSLYPTSEDVLCRNEDVFLRPNFINGPYEDVEHYLDVTFRLIREDFIRPLREGVAAHIKGDKEEMRNSSVRIYKDVTFVRSDDEIAKAAVKRNRDTEGTLISFDRQKKLKKFDWEHSRRFMFNSLLVFSKDNFRTLLITTVSDRDINLLEAGLLRVEFTHEINENENIYSTKYTMAECEVFFDPYFHVMKTLQGLDEASFPMARYLVNVDKDDYPPEYLEPAYDGQPQVSYLVKLQNREWPFRVVSFNSWPTAEELELDNSQYRALQAGLTRELVVIQGPPGTGKTFIGLKIAEILTTNKAETQRSTPILVVCLTNHALDQFLMGMLKFTRKIVRIGGQSKCEEMTQYNLRLLRRQTASRDQLRLLSNLRIEISRLQTEITEFDSDIKTVRAHPGIVSYQMFQDADLLPENCIKAFEKGLFIPWLLDDSTAPRRDEFFTVKGNDHIKYDLLLEEFDKKLQDIETQKGVSGCDYDLLEDQQSRVAGAKEWIKDKLQTSRPTTFKDAKQWTRNLAQLHVVQRWELYAHWLEQLQKILFQRIQHCDNELVRKRAELAELQVVDDLELLRDRDIVGMTTTGAARLHNLLRKLGPEIVIVEEAAEVMEAHVVACLTQHCQHLILIGDHKQLRPQIATYGLGVDYQFDVSLFERMVLNRPRSLVTLNVQHRMTPEVAQLISPAIYPNLRNAEEVSRYPAVPGVPRRLFFVDHTKLEASLDKDSHSKVNTHEASFLMALCRHLILQEIKPEHITILTMYQGQMFHIRQEMKRQQSLKGVHVTVVDNYQGEENEVILLSLVRSNAENKIGFLRTENRVCVALSRAKRGLYIIGNMSCLTQAAKLKPEDNIWRKINATLQNQGAIGRALPLRCQVHPDQEFTVSSVRDFTVKSPEGGCLQKCTSMLICGHVCDRVCHAEKRDHVDMKCVSVCDRVCEAMLHRCTKKCYEICGECEVLVLKTLPCGHQQTIPCYVDEKKLECDVIVEKMFPLCQHRPQVPCHTNVEKDFCPCKCDTRLDCGHDCTRRCHTYDDPDHLKYVCRKPCGRPNKGCSLNHECGKLCCDECAECIIKVPKRRTCGHTVHVLCSEDPELTPCRAACTRKMYCGHRCEKECGALCDPCPVKVKKMASCGHVVLVACGVRPDPSACKQKCERLLPCGHPCKAACKSPCTEHCMERVSVVRGNCGHNIPLYCWELQNGVSPSNSSRCTEPCGVELECGHWCPGTCGRCCQGRFHELCDQKCERVLVCGHSCKEPCAEMCPPCKEDCTYACDHSKCRKKCGVPCAPCKERCIWRCEHKQCKRKCGEPCNREPCEEPCPKKLRCGHDCVSFCGEPCPPLCRECNKDELTEIFFGNEDEIEAKFVLLPDCGHVLEAEGLQQWMSQDNEEVALKACPKCKTTISLALRYSNDIKKIHEMIAKIKIKLFGSPQTIEIKREQLQQTLTALIDPLEAEGPTFDELVWCLKAARTSLDKTIDKKKNILSGTDIRAREIEVDILAKVCKVWQSCAKQPQSVQLELQAHVNVLLENLQARKHRIGQQQVTDFTLEVMRLQRIVQYLSFKHHGASRSDVRALLPQMEALVMNLTQRYTTDGDKRAEQLYHQLKEACRFLPGLGIDEFERVQIVQALRLSKGHWFICPNGHPYVITECGGAMIESTCPECGARIGGGSHRLREDNRHFALMDLSHHAAWSDQANMGNYQFD